MWTIVLIDDDRVVNVMNNSVGERDIRNNNWFGRSSPCFDPEAVVSFGKGTIGDIYTFDILLIVVFVAYAPNADPVARTTVYTGDVNVRVAISNGYVIVSRGYVRIDDRDAITSSKVDPVSVGAVTRGRYLNVLYDYIIAI